MSFGLVVLFGAPYLPTLKAQADEAFKLLDLKPNQTLLDLGSGDGTMLIAAAKRDINAIGYEINPILFAVSWLRVLPYRKRVRVRLRNFWTIDLPEADGIFVFLHTRFMQKLHTKVINSNRSKKLRLVSFAFELPSKKPTKRIGSLFLYVYDPRA